MGNGITDKKGKFLLKTCGEDSELEIRYLTGSMLQESQKIFSSNSGLPNMFRIGEGAAL